MILMVFAAMMVANVFGQNFSGNDGVYGCFNKCNKTKKSEFYLDSEFFKKYQQFSIGGGFSYVYNGDKPYAAWTVDIIIAGAYLSVGCGDSSDREKGEFKLGDFAQVGYLFPICKFGKEDGIRDDGWDIALSAGPIVEFSGTYHVEGHYLHENTHYHICTYWVDTSYYTHDKTSFGAVAMLRYKYGTLTAKYTTNSFGFAVGIGF